VLIELLNRMEQNIGLSCARLCANVLGLPIVAINFMFNIRLQFQLLTGVGLRTYDMDVAGSHGKRKMTTP